MQVHEPNPGYRYCPRCAGTFELRSVKTGEPDRLVCSACGFVFYLDPKVAVGTIIADPHGRVVLTRRTIDPGWGKWVFPGGYVDRGELVTRAAVREAREECGLDVRIDRLLNVYSYAGSSVIIVVYTASAIGGTLAAGDEVCEAAWFEPGEIPWNALAFPSTIDALTEFLGRAGQVGREGPQGRER
jgi:8-oxo-dGTP diphosphatase